MKIKEEVMREVEGLGPIGLTRVYELIRSLKSAASNSVVPRKSLGRPAYLKVREALTGCTGSLSADVETDREERL